MRRLLVHVGLSALGAILVGSIVAWASNTTIGVTAGSGKNANLISFASTNVIGETGICDATTENACGSIGTYGTAPGAVNALNVNASVTNANANGQATMANSSPVALASNQSVADPCTFQKKSQKNISTASGTTLLVAASGSTSVYICSFSLIVPSAVAVSLSEGTGATCNTANQAGIIGVAVNGTAANGMSFAANGGLTYGDGNSTVAFTATAGDAVCLFQSGTAQLAGNITFIQQ